MKKKILIIDDNRETCLEIRKYFDDHYKTYLIDDVITATEQLDINSDFFCILIDLKLDNKSDLGGIEIIKHIVKHKIKNNFIIFSAYSPLSPTVMAEFMDRLNMDESEILELFEYNYILKGNGNYLINIEEKLNDLTLKEQEAKYNFGKYFALLIGVNDYKHHSIASLNNPIKDAEALGHILHEKYGFDTEVIKNPTRKEIIAKLFELRNISNNYDNLLIFFAGHGEWDNIAEFGYWLPADAEKNCRANWITNCEVKSYLLSVKIKHIALLVDACFAGTMAIQDRNISILPYELMHTKKSRMVLTSCEKQPTPDKSIFLENLLKYLNDTLDTKNISTIFNDLRKVVISKSGVNNTLIPLLSTLNNHEAGGEFIFVRK